MTPDQTARLINLACLDRFDELWAEHKIDTGSDVLNESLKHASILWFRMGVAQGCIEFGQQLPAMVAACAGEDEGA